MKSHIVIAKMLMYQPGDHMLPGVLLHKIKASVPVHMSCYLAAHSKGLLYHMKDLLLTDLYIQYFLPIQCSCICSLSPFLWEEGSAVQQHLEAAVFQGSALQYCPGKIYNMSVLIK